MQITDIPQDTEPRVGDIIEIEQGEDCFEVRIIGITADGYLCEQDNVQGAVLLEGTALDHTDVNDIMPLVEGLRDPKDNPCWKGYHPVGTKKKNGRTVPNCVPNAKESVEEAGPFSYGAKKPRRGSVADLADKKRREQEKNRPPIEPKDQMVGTAKLTKDVSETSDYFRRREREEAIISGQKPARKKQPAQTSDYARRREQEKKAEKGVAEGYSNTTFKIKRRKLNVPALIKAGAIFITYPHGEQGWELDNKEDWAYSLISLYNVMGGGWQGEAKKYLKPESYKKAEQKINSSAPNLGSDKLVYDGKYNQILWSIKKLGIPDNVAFLDNDKQGVAEGVDIVKQDYDLDQMVYVLDVDGQKVSFTYWDYEDDFNNPDIKDIYQQAQEQLGKKLSPEQVKEVARVVFKSFEQGVSESNTSTTAQGSYVVANGSKVKKFKTLQSAKAYAEKNGGKISSEEVYSDKMQKQGVAEANGQWTAGLAQTMGSFGAGFSSSRLEKAIVYYLQGRHQEGASFLGTALSGTSPEVADKIKAQLEKLPKVNVDPNTDANTQKYIKDKVIPWINSQLSAGTSTAPSAAVLSGQSTNYSVGISDNVAAQKIADKIKGMPVNSTNIQNYVKKYLSMTGKNEKDLPQLSLLVYDILKKQGVAESGLQYHTGVKKHGEEYMRKAAQAGREGASQEEIGRLRDRYSKAYKKDVKEGGEDWGSMSKHEFKRRELEHELGHEVNRPREQPKGMWFYNVPTMDLFKAKAMGLRQSRSGKWYSTSPNARADQAYGPGRYWEPKNKGMGEAKYHGREVPLNKKMKGDVAKSKVYVRKPNGKVVKVNFGDPNMRIRKSDPKRRKSFRARHNCANPGPRWRARYWSCKSW